MKWFFEIIRSFKAMRLSWRIINQFEKVGKEPTESNLSSIHEQVEGFMDLYRREPTAQEIERMIATL